MARAVKGVFLATLTVCSSASADFDWISVTLDNDAFVETDNGYTNGLYISMFETGESSRRSPTADFWVAPLTWSLPPQGDRQSVNACMIGQTMITPSDIAIENPTDKEIPYSATVALINSY